MADNVGVTPGIGASVATDDVGGVQYQRVKNVWGADGVANDVSRAAPLPISLGVEPTDAWLINIASTVHVAVANTIMWDLFNADSTAIVRVMSIRQIPNITTAVTGIVFDWKLARTTAVGTGGTPQTALKTEMSQAALSANITSRLKPSGGATEGDILFNYSISSEETTPATIQIATQGGLELIPSWQQQNGQGIRLAQNEGLRLVQITSSIAGNTAWLISFTVE